MAENELRFRGKTRKEETETSTTQENDTSEEKRVEIKSDLTKSFWLTRIVFLRGLAFIYFVAFCVSFNQNKELIGDDGLLPVKLYMSRIKENQKEPSNLALFLQVPTMFWFLESWDNMNFYLDLTAIAGMILSAFVFIKGAGNAFILFTLWILYHSLVNVGQRWFSFGWESQLLETGTYYLFVIINFNTFGPRILKSADFFQNF